MTSASLGAALAFTFTHLEPTSIRSHRAPCTSRGPRLSSTRTPSGNGIGELAPARRGVRARACARATGTRARARARVAFSGDAAARARAQASASSSCARLNPAASAAMALATLSARAACSPRDGRRRVLLGGRVRLGGRARRRPRPRRRPDPRRTTRAARCCSCSAPRRSWSSASSSSRRRGGVEQRERRAGASAQRTFSVGAQARRVVVRALERVKEDDGGVGGLVERRAESLEPSKDVLGGGGARGRARRQHPPADGGEARVRLGPSRSVARSARSKSRHASARWRSCCVHPPPSGRRGLRRVPLARRRIGGRPRSERRGRAACRARRSDSPSLTSRPSPRRRRSGEERGALLDEEPRAIDHDVRGHLRVGDEHHALTREGQPDDVAVSPLRVDDEREGIRAERHRDVVGRAVGEIRGRRAAARWSCLASCEGTSATPRSAAVCILSATVAKLRMNAAGSSPRRRRGRVGPLRSRGYDRASNVAGAREKRLESDGRALVGRDAARARRAAGRSRALRDSVWRHPRGHRLESNDGRAASSYPPGRTPDCYPPRCRLRSRSASGSGVRYPLRLIWAGRHLLAARRITHDPTDARPREMFQNLFGNPKGAQKGGAPKAAPAGASPRRDLGPGDLSTSATLAESTRGRPPILVSPSRPLRSRPIAQASARGRTAAAARDASAAPTASAAPSDADHAAHSRASSAPETTNPRLAHRYR